MKILRGLPDRKNIRKTMTGKAPVMLVHGSPYLFILTVRNQPFIKRQKRIIIRDTQRENCRESLRNYMFLNILKSV